MTTGMVFGQTLALRLGDGDEHRALESDTLGLNVKGNLDTGKTLGRTTFRTWPKSLKNPQQPSRGTFSFTS